MYFIIEDNMNRFKDKCPICGGDNSKMYGGNKRCFHCKVCSFVECMYTKKNIVGPAHYEKLIDIISNRIRKFYEDKAS